MEGLSRREVLGSAALLPGLGLGGPARAAATMQSWPLDTPVRTGIHDVAPAPDGGVWFTAQRSGHLGWFDPRSGQWHAHPGRPEISGGYTRDFKSPFPGDAVLLLTRP